ncbi:MAG: MBL fold metallo-hydrolase [Melioribacteraceae bacterium]
MEISRKQFIKSSFLLTGGLFLQGSSFFNLLEDGKNGIKKLRNNIGIYIEKGGTIGWYAGKDYSVVIDSQFPDSAKNFFDNFSKMSGGKIDLLFNTHHHGDHTSGNIYLRDHTKTIVAHENCKMLQEKMYGGNPDKIQAYPDITFVQDWELDLRKEKVTARYFAPAHTGGDSVIHFENANIAHIGDHVFNHTYPYIDNMGGGSIKYWIETLEMVYKKYDKDTLFIYGHADTDEHVTGSKADIRNMKNYFEALVDTVNRGIKAGKSKDEVASGEIPGFNNLKERWDGARKMNLERAYDEFTKA